MNRYKIGGPQRYIPKWRPVRLTHDTNGVDLLTVYYEEKFLEKLADFLLIFKKLD